jgi:hypothetical protein
MKNSNATTYVLKINIPGPLPGHPPLARLQCLQTTIVSIITQPFCKPSLEFGQEIHDTRRAPI